MNDYSNLFKNDNNLNKESLEDLYKTKILEIGTPNKNNRIFSEEIFKDFEGDTISEVVLNENNPTKEDFEELLFLNERQIKKRKNSTANNILKNKKERKIRSTSYYRNFKKKK